MHGLSTERTARGSLAGPLQALPVPSQAQALARSVRSGDGHPYAKSNIASTRHEIMRSECTDMWAELTAQAFLRLPQPVATAGTEILAEGACAGSAGRGTVLSWHPVAHQPHSHEHAFESADRQTLRKRPSSFLLAWLTPA